MNDSVPSTTPPPATSTTSTAIGRLLAMAIAVRLFVDTGIQIFAPFLAQIAAGLGISIVALGALNSLRSLMGLAAPGFASLTNRIGYRSTLRLLLLLGAAGMFIFSFSQNLVLVIPGIIFMGLGLFSFASILQAYISALISYDRRARALGTVEYAWALAGILGLFLSGLLIERFGWRAPFIVLGAGLLGGFVLMSRLPATEDKQRPAGSRPEVAVFRPLSQQLRALVALEHNRRSAWSAILAAMFVVLAVSNLSIIYGAWLTRDYDLTTAQLGLVALVLGLTDLAASALVSLRGDRLGKARLVRFSTVAAVLSYALLPLLNSVLLTAMAGLLATRLFFEIAMVANISLLSEQVPTQRATVLTLASALVTVGAAIGSLTGPIIFSTWDLPGVALLSAASVLCAALLVWRWVLEPATPEPGPATQTGAPFNQQEAQS